MVTIGTWNLENLYRPGGDGPTTQEAYDAKLATLVDTIKAHAPDVLAVQEVGQPAAFTDLLEALGAGWNGVLSGHPDARGIRVGFLSRVAASATTDLLAFPASLEPVQVGDPAAEGEPPAMEAAMGRGGLHATYDVGGVTWDLVTVHLKSKLLTYPGGRFAPRDEDQRARYGAYALFRRTAEATTVRMHVNTLLTDLDTRRVVVLGDLNDTEQAATTQLLYGPSGSQFGTGGFSHPDKGDVARLWNLAPQLPADHHYSRINEGQPELIDHILISHALLDGFRSVDADVSQLESITPDPRARANAPASDHAPLIAQFA
ncbi:endonuclease/exonuclease/phosphatase family protein [Nocardioides cheoyonin]|uniref:endonuclease/exonuclease/phosphatase family protein n=1 Tax=Nocardioides cheoyonin TaxID=3156615 RepID=UPI0032B3AAD1